MGRKSTVHLLGEKKKMNNGLLAEVIREEGHLIDVRFENGAVVKDRMKADFILGRIACPGVNTRYEQAKMKRLGEKHRMKDGREGEIIRYGSSVDIDIRFSDGTEVIHKSLSAFRKGYIRNPNCPSTLIDTRLSEKRKMSCGLMAEIIEYRRCDDMTVRFEDGSTLDHVSYDSFKRGSLSPGAARKPDALKKTRLGEKRLMKSGLMGEIIGYDSATDITVRLSDGTICPHKWYRRFISGNIGRKDAITDETEEKKGE